MKTGIIITARLKSSRLAKKVIKKIAGRPMIAHMIDRLKESGRAKAIVVNTSTNPQDDPLVDIAKAERVLYFRGDEDDVLKRMYDAAVYHGIDCIISCTADNPFVDPVFIDELVEYHMSEKNDYTKTDGLPLGAFAYALNRDAVGKALSIKDSSDTEVWGGYFTETGMFKTGVLEMKDRFFRRPELRLTVDYSEDFEFVKRIFEALYDGKRVFSLREILEHLDRHPELLDINKHVQQKQGAPIRVKVKTKKTVTEA